LEKLKSILSQLSEPLWLVVDAFENVTHGQVSADLVDLASECAPLSLVLVGRTTKWIDKFSASRIAVNVISEADLAFTPGETTTILSEADPNMSDGDTAEAHRRMGGWPLATGLLARSLSGSPRLHPDSASMTTAAIARALGQIGAALGRDTFALAARLSLVEVLNPDIAGVLLSGEISAERSEAELETRSGLLARLEANGLLSAARGPTSEQHWSPLMQTVIYDDFKIREPRLALELEARIAEWFAANNAPELALIHAMSARRWDLFVTYVGIQPLTITTTQWSSLTSAFGATPVETIVPDTTASTLRTIALQLPIDLRITPSPKPLTSAEVTAISGSPHVRRALERHLWLLALYRG